MSTIKNEQVARTLNTLHEKASLNSAERAQLRKAGNFDKAWDTAYLAVSREEGEFLNFLATVSNSKNIVEFGCSFGISTIYLAAAAKDNGGSVITTDIEPNKVAGTLENLKDAGLADVVSVLLGDATQTLSAIEDIVDFLFLDGAKDLYLPVFNLLRPKLIKGAIVFADNADKEDTRPFVDYILSCKDEFTTLSLFENRAFLARIN